MIREATHASHGAMARFPHGRPPCDLEFWSVGGGGTTKMNGCQRFETIAADLLTRSKRSKRRLKADSLLQPLHHESRLG
jgi:hypothetical protein